jgi:glycerophosphoryl diester phosphodiesterase
MTSTIQRLTRLAAASAATALALGFAGAPTGALAASNGNVAYAKGSEVTATVTVKAINAKTRELTVTTESGDTELIKAPSGVQNFSKIKVGDKIKATYLTETEFVISSPNQPLPKDAEATVAARAAKGQLPAAVVANHMVVSGNVLAIDMAKHTIKMVNARGGEVHTFTVQAADRQKAMSKLKVGDTITVYITEHLLIAAHPA